ETIPQIASNENLRQNRASRSTGLVTSEWISRPATVCPDGIHDDVQGHRWATSARLGDILQIDPRGIMLGCVPVPNGDLLTTHVASAVGQPRHVPDTQKGQRDARDDPGENAPPEWGSLSSLWPGAGTRGLSLSRHRRRPGGHGTAPGAAASRRQPDRPTGDPFFV